MLLGHWIEMRSVIGASTALDDIMKLMPDMAHVIGEDGTIAEHKTEMLKAGERILVKPGEKIPVDGIVFEGVHR
jgi:Cu2+-exporting ATPase